MTDPRIAEWFLELVEGKRIAATTMVRVERVRSNPFTPLAGRGDGEGQTARRDERAMGARTVGRRLPSGDFVDVDTPYDCEVVKRARFKFVIVHVLGTLTEIDCARIGIET